MVQTSYDIIKAHCGELKVETEEDSGSEFIISLKNSNRYENLFNWLVAVNFRNAGHYVSDAPQY
jgi:hypothetical protein